jgi:hypothetical protein
MRSWGLVYFWAVVLILSAANVLGQSEPFEKFKAALNRGDNLGALALVAAGQDTTLRTSEYIGSKAKELFENAQRTSNLECADAFASLLYTRTLINHAQDGNATFRIQQNISSYVSERFKVLDRDCRAEVLNGMLEKLNALPSYTGALAVAYMELFPLMEEGEVRSFLRGSAWVNPLLEKHRQQMEGTANFLLGQFVFESLAISAAVSYARLQDGTTFSGIPDPLAYVSISHRFAREAMATKTKSQDRYSALIPISYMVLMMDESIVKSTVTEESMADHLGLVIEIVSRLQEMDLPRSMSSLKDQLTPVYYSALLKVYSVPYAPENARAAVLRTAEFVAEEHDRISAMVGPCELARATAAVMVHSIMYNLQIDEASETLLEYLAETDTVFTTCALHLDSDDYPDEWGAFQKSLSYCASLGEYRACTSMMAIAAGVLSQESYASIRSGWMDFMLTTFNSSIRHDTITNSLRSTREMSEFVSSYVAAKDGLYTDEQGLFVLLHLAKMSEYGTQSAHDRCALIDRVGRELKQYGASGGLLKFAQVLNAECGNLDNDVIKLVREFAKSDYGPEFADAQIFGLTMLFAAPTNSKRREDYVRYVELTNQRYGECSPQTLRAIGDALWLYQEIAEPLEVKQLLDQFYASYYRAECGVLASWLPAFMNTKSYISNNIALSKVFETDMRNLFGSLKPEDCRSFEDMMAYVSWMCSSWTSWLEAEQNGRIALAVLNSVGGEDPARYFAERRSNYATTYRENLMLAYSTMCSAFSDVTDPSPDSLCHYVALMQGLMATDAGLVETFGAHVRKRLDQCAALRGEAKSEFDGFLSRDELEAIDADGFASYIQWYQSKVKDTVFVINSNYSPDEYKALLASIRPIESHTWFLLTIAKKHGLLAVYYDLIMNWALWTPSTIHKEYLLEVLESLHARYPELSGSLMNTRSLDHPRSDIAIILQDKYMKQSVLDYRYLGLIQSKNMLDYSDMWANTDAIDLQQIINDVLKELTDSRIENGKEAHAWLALAKTVTVLVLENGTNAQVEELRSLLGLQRKALQSYGVANENTIEGREYSVLIDLLRARSKPGTLNSAMESALLELITPQAGSETIDAGRLVRAYAAVLKHHPDKVVSDTVISMGLERLSYPIWYDMLYKNEKLPTTVVEMNLSSYWRVVRGVLTGGERRQNVDLTRSWIKTLYVQYDLLVLVKGLRALDEIGFDEPLYRLLVESYRSLPETERPMGNEFGQLVTLYDQLFRVKNGAQKEVDCPTAKSTERYWRMLSGSRPMELQVLQTREALRRYAMLACDAKNKEPLVGPDEDMDLWLRLPLPTAILGFERDVAAGVYRLEMATADSVYEEVIGNIVEVEQSWRQWMEQIESGENVSVTGELPEFWKPVVTIAAKDSTAMQYIMVPDGIYYNVNPSVLPLEKTGQVRVDVVVDLDDYLRPTVPTNRTGSVVLVGGLDYGGPEGQRFALAEQLRADRGLDQKGGWVKLPGTAREVEAIADKLKAKSATVDLITGSSASTQRLQGLAFPQAIHFATHGFVDKRDGGRKAGLVLSGANSASMSDTLPGSGGYLYAEDIRELDLFACDLVVLSACRTAVSSNGQGQGEIIKAFKDAGVSKVIASSWAVPDECTSMLMGYFYDYYLAGVPASLALTEAQRKVAVHFPNSRDWAAFMVYH